MFKVILVILGAAVIVILGIVDIKTENDNKRRCEQLGGIYYSGNFAADNCVFPPEGK